MLYHFVTFDWVNLIIAVASLIMAITALFTIFEIKKQRDSSYHPDLNMSDFELYVYRLEEEELEEELLFLYHSKERLKASSSRSGYNEVLVEINNIGFGVAKHILLEWKFDINKARNSIELEDENSSWIETNGELFLNYPDYCVDWVILVDEDNMTDQINFILPFSKTSIKSEIRIPTYFIDLYWLYKVKGLYKSIGNEEYPPLSLTLSYTDIHGKNYKKIFSLELKWHMIAEPSYTDKNGKKASELAKFKVEFKELNKT